MANVAQRAIRCVIMRGGTSKGLYLHADDLPAPGPERDAVLLRLMGSPDHLQIDGLGGGRPITSKIAIVAPSTRDDADVDYTFGQAEIAGGSVLWAGNCGNISAGVGPFAVDEGLVPAVEGITAVRIFNTNTQRILVADVPVSNGQAKVEGDLSIAGVPGSGAEIVMNWSKTVGATTGRLLPTGRPVDLIPLEGGGGVRVTLCDVANPFVWITAEDLSVDQSDLVEEISHSPALQATIREVRGKAAVLFGFCSDWRTADDDSGGFPIPGIVAKSTSYTTLAGHQVSVEDIDVRIHVVFMDRLHESVPGTGSICLAAASQVKDSVVHRAARDRGKRQLLIGQPSGVTPVDVEVRPIDEEPWMVFERLGISRTARRLMAGEAYIPWSTLR